MLRSIFVWKMKKYGKNLLDLFHLIEVVCRKCLMKVRRFTADLIKLDDVVENPIYCVAAVFQTLGILHVLPRPFSQPELIQRLLRIKQCLIS